MWNSLNKAQVIGNITADPEVKETPTGTQVATFTVATNRKWKDTAGTVQEDTEFHAIVAWRGLAELAEKYIKKGKKIFVEWYMKTRVWEWDDGKKRYKTEIVAENIIFLSNSRPGDEEPV